MLSIMSRPPGHRDADIKGRGHGISHRICGISLRGSGIAESAADRRNAAMNKADFGRA
jgi:hypothetical protein